MMGRSAARAGVEMLACGRTRRLVLTRLRLAADVVPGAKLITPCAASTPAVGRM